MYHTIRLSKVYGLPSGYEFVPSQLSMENLLSVHQALRWCLEYLGNKGPASVGKTGKCSIQRTVTWETQEMMVGTELGKGVWEVTFEPRRPVTSR